MQHIKELLSKNLSVIIRKDNKTIFQSSGHMLHDLARCVRMHKREMENAVAIDRVVGLAAARLLAYARVKEVHALLASEFAIRYLQKRGIPIYARKVVKSILNRGKTDMCPMERMALACRSDAEFYKMISTPSAL